MMSVEKGPGGLNQGFLPFPDYPVRRLGGILVQINVHSILANLPLFNEMCPEEIARLALGVRELHLSRSDNLFHGGDASHGFYIVVYGQVKLAFSSTKGTEKVVKLVGPGQSFGEAVMFLGKPYPLSAHVLADSLVLHISKAVVYEEIARDPTFCRKMLAGLSMRLHGLVHDVESYSLHSSAQRVIGYLLQHETTDIAAGKAVNIHLTASKNIIASRLNITPETFSRILHDLCAANLISVEGKDIAILDVEKFRNHG